jgi:hypothetical protein
VKNWFQSLPFKCNLQRYIVGFADKLRLMNLLMDDIRPYKVGLYTLTPPDP